MTEIDPALGGVEPYGDPAYGCGVCYLGMVSVTRGGRTLMYACLCERGKQKKRLASIQIVLDEAALQQLWPGGVPKAASPERVLELLADAQIPPKYLPWSLASYAQYFAGDRDQQRYLALGEAWVQQPNEARSDLIFFGQNGCGKTGLAIALVRAVAQQHQQHSRFWTLRELVIAWRNTFREDVRETDGPSERDFLGLLVDVPILIIDEVSGQKLSTFVEDTLTLIVDKRQREQRPTILTLNTAVDVEDDAAALAELLGPTLLDRLRERGQWWPMKGLSRRKTYSRQQESAR